MDNEKSLYIAVAVIGFLALGSGLGIGFYEDIIKKKPEFQIKCYEVEQLKETKIGEEYKKCKQINNAICFCKEGK